MSPNIDPPYPWSPGYADWRFTHPDPFKTVEPSTEVQEVRRVADKVLDVLGITLKRLDEVEKRLDAIERMTRTQT